MTADSSGRPASLPRLVTVEEPQSIAAEAYRTLGANLRFGYVDPPVRTILLTSADPDDGKTTVLANLGVTAARGGQNVILVDCDLRHPSLHQVFGLPNETGVATVLAGESPTALPLQETTIPGLRLLTSGPSPLSPADLLSREGTDRLLATLASSADLVLIDAPPATGVADAAILAPRVDGVVLVVAAMRTRREHAQRAKVQIERVHGRLLGVIVANARVDRRAFRY